MTSELRVDAIKNTDGTDVMNFDSGGRILTPDRPFFYARPSTQVDDHTADPIPYGTAVKNIGNHYSTSTYKFTCPVDGVYFFAGQVYKEGTNCNIKLKYNDGGSDTYMAEVGRMIGASPAEHSALTFAITVYFSSGTTVWMSRDTGTYHQNTSLSYFTGCLIG